MSETTGLCRSCKAKCEINERTALPYIHCNTHRYLASMKMKMRGKRRKPNEEKSIVSSVLTVSQNSTVVGSIYIVQPKEFLNSNIYKIASSTKTVGEIMRGETQNSNLEYIRRVKNHMAMEKIVLAVCDGIFSCQKECGLAYFKGDISDIRSVIDDVIGQWENQIKA